jgi:Kae1-associated kinase Bud32
MESSDKTMEIKMSFIKGRRVSEILNINNYKEICSQIGKIISKLHKNDIIHGDLTTSNFIYQKGKVFIIDFGLSFISKKIEDKAVDLHLLKQALESKHYEISESAFNKVLNSYKCEKDVLNRLNQVEKRGRKKNKD